MADKMRLSFGLEHRWPGWHYFDFPAEVRRAVESYTTHAIRRVAPKRFHQEADYVAAIAANLDGQAYSGKHGDVSFSSTIVSSRGPNSAESWAGADWIITASVTDGRVQVDKAIMFQAKLGSVAELAAKECEDLRGQIKNMRRFTRSPKVLEIPGVDGERLPNVISGTGLLAARRYQIVPLGRFLSSRVITTSHGDTRPGFVMAVQESQLTKLHVLARLKR